MGPSAGVQQSDLSGQLLNGAVRASQEPATCSNRPHVAHSAAGSAAHILCTCACPCPSQQQHAVACLPAYLPGLVPLADHCCLAAGKDKGLLAPLVPGHQDLEAEVVHCVRAEYCSRPEDFLARRSRMAFLDVAAARAAVPRVAELMAGELGWSAARRKRAVEEALAYLDTFST